MKKVLFSLSMLAFFAAASQAQGTTGSTSSSASGYNTKTTFGLEAGVGFQKFYGDDQAGNNLDMKMAVKWHAGVTADIPLASTFSFQPGVMLATKGGRYEKTNSSPETRFNLYYVDVPMNFVYKPATGTGHVLVGFGPYVGFGVGGKYISENTGGDVKTDIEYRGEVSTSDDPTKVYFKRFDGGANVFVGYESANRFLFKVGTQIGLVNISPDYAAFPNYKTNTKNLGVGLSIGYRLGK